jgi:hypothetical protein
VQKTRVKVLCNVVLHFLEQHFFKTILSSKDLRWLTRSGSGWLVAKNLRPSK